MYTSHTAYARLHIHLLYYSICLHSVCLYSICLHTLKVCISIVYATTDEVAELNLLAFCNGKTYKWANSIIYNIHIMYLLVSFSFKCTYACTHYMYITLLNFVTKSSHSLLLCYIKLFVFVVIDNFEIHFMYRPIHTYIYISN